MEDLLAFSSSQLILGTLLPGWEDDYFAKPPIHPIAGLGQIQHSVRDEEGNFNFVVQGLQRVRILGESTPPKRDYRQVEFEPLVEPQLSSADSPAQRDGFLQALVQLSGNSAEHAAGRSINYLADVLLVMMPLPMEQKLQLYSILNPQQRADAVLKAWQLLQNEAPPPPATGPGVHPNSN